MCYVLQQYPFCYYRKAKPRTVDQNPLPDNINLTSVDLPEFIKIQYEAIAKQKEEGN